MKTQIRGAITPDMLIVQHECKLQFQKWVEKTYGVFYTLKTYCDGELYADFGHDNRVSFREYVFESNKGRR